MFFFSYDKEHVFFSVVVMIHVIQLMMVLPLPYVYLASRAIRDCEDPAMGSGSTELLFSFLSESWVAIVSPFGNFNSLMVTPSLQSPVHESVPAVLAFFFAFPSLSQPPPPTSTSSP